jgi:hypothetical protein
MLMRACAIVFFVLGFFLLSHAAYDECRGTTRMPTNLFGTDGLNGVDSHYLRVVTRSQNPDMFREFMGRHWLYAGSIAAVGCALFAASKSDWIHLKE